MSDLIEVVIDSVRVSLMSPQRIVVLREKDVDRYLPIWVGPYEAEAITIALQEVEMVRPLTHDLLKNVFTSFNARIERVEINSLKGDIFYGNLVAEVDGRIIRIDSRPSDAIALAIRAHVPIWVGRDVLDAAGITPEQDIQEQEETSPADENPAPPQVAEGDERLSIFEDFLKKLDDEDHPKKEN
jgi:hypothetical protein